MRVVGGKLGADKKLGTYVSTVVPGGVADKAGIVKGQSSTSAHTCTSRMQRCINLAYFMISFSVRIAKN